MVRLQLSQLVCQVACSRIALARHRVGKPRNIRPRRVAVALNCVKRRRRARRRLLRRPRLGSQLLYLCAVPRRRSARCRCSGRLQACTQLRQLAGMHRAHG